MPAYLHADWSVKNDYREGGLKGAPKPEAPTSTRPTQGEEELAEAAAAAPIAHPSRVRRAWEFYAEELYTQVGGCGEGVGEGEEAAIQTLNLGPQPPWTSTTWWT